MNHFQHERLNRFSEGISSFLTAEQIVGILQKRV